MNLRKYELTDNKNIIAYYGLFGIVPFKFFRYIINPFSFVNDSLTGFSMVFVSLLYFIGIWHFQPKFISIIETRYNEIRFFKLFYYSTKWTTIDQYRYIADYPELKKIKVYKKNCKEIGRINLKLTKAEEKKEFLAKIEPWLVIRGEDSAYLSKDLVKSSD